MKLSTNVIGQGLLTILHMSNALTAFVPAQDKFYVAAALGFIQGFLGILAHLRNPDGTPVAQPYGLSEADLAAYQRIFSGAAKAIAFVAIALSLSVPAIAQQPLPDTLLSTGIVSNFNAPYHPAPYVAAGMLVTSAESALPIYAGMRYELYVDAAGKPAYAGLAFAKVIIYHKNRFFCFAEPAIGGAGTITGVSSALQLGGGCGMQLGKFSATNTPHWEVFAEPQARRIPALDNGTQKAFLAGISYTFNRPK